MTKQVAVTSPDVAKYRTSDSHSLQGLSAYIIPKSVVATAVVVTPSATTPMVELSVVSFTGYANVLVGQMVKIYNNISGIKAWCVIVKAPTSDRIYLNPTALGDSLYPDGIELFVETGDMIEVYSYCPLVGLYSTIRGGVFYKSWNVPHTDQNVSPPPVSNSGQWQIERSADDQASFTLPRGGVNHSFGLQSSISSHAWDIGAGTLNGGSLSDAVISATFPVGTHRVSQTVVDSRGKSHTSYTWVVVTGDDNPDLSSYSIEIGSDTQSSDGREISISLYGDVWDDTFLPGCAMVFREWPKFGTADLSNMVHNDLFVGYCVSKTLTRGLEDGVNRLDLTFVSPYIAASDIQQPPQALIESPSVTNWTQCNYTLSNPEGALYYSIKWHTPTLLDWHDLQTNGWNSPRKKSYRYDTNSLADAMHVSAEALAGGVVGCRSDGTVVLTVDPTMRQDAYRNANPLMWTWLPRDIASDITYNRSQQSKVGSATSGAFAYDGTNIYAFGVIRRWGQASGRSTLKDFTVTPSEGAVVARAVIGHYVAQKNNSIPSMSVTVNRNLDFCDPVDMLWHYLDLSSVDIPLTGRFLVTKIDRTWTSNPDGWDKTVKLTFRKETRGQPGEDLPKSSSTTGDTGWSPSTPSPFKLEVPSMPSLALTWDSGGHLYRTTDYASVSPRWEDITLQLGDGYSVCHVDWNFDSDYFQLGRNLLDSLGVFVLATKGTRLFVFRITEIRSPRVDINKTDIWDMHDDSCKTGANIRSNRETSGWTTLAWKDRHGVYMARTVNGGETWINPGIVVGLEADPPDFTGSYEDSALIDDWKVALDVWLDTEVIIGRGTATRATLPYTLWRYNPDTGYPYERIPNAPFTFWPSRTCKIIDHVSILADEPRVEIDWTTLFDDLSYFTQPSAGGYIVTSDARWFFNGDFNSMSQPEAGWVKFTSSETAASVDSVYFKHQLPPNTVIERIRYRYKTNILWFIVNFSTPLLEFSDVPNIGTSIGVGPTYLGDPGPFPTYPTVVDRDVDIDKTIWGTGDVPMTGRAESTSPADGFISLHHYQTVGHSGAGRLYRIDDWFHDDGDVVTVTPEGHSPRTNTGLSYNPITEALETVGSANGVTFKWYKSEDYGETWEEVGDANASGVFAFDDVSLLIRAQQSAVVIDYTDIEEKPGNMAIIIGSRTVRDLLTGLEL